MKKTITFMMAAILLAAITSSLKAQDTTHTDFKPSGKLWGQVFGDFQYKQHSDSAQRGSTQYAGKAYTTKYSSFEFRRIYLGYDYNFAENFTSQVLLSHEGNNYDAQGNRSFLLKYANIRWRNIFKGSDLVLGATATNSYALLAEQIWGYRSVEKTILDMRGIAKSTDFGIALQGKFTADGNYGYNAMYANNSGYAPENNNYKKVYGDVYAKFLDKKIIVDVYGDYELSQLQPFVLSKTTYKGFVAYNANIVTVGVEVFAQNNKNYDYFTPAGTTAKDTGVAMPLGFSIWAHAPVYKDKLAAFARFDSFDPDTKYSSDNAYTSSSVNGRVKEMFYTAGIDFTPAKNVHFMPNVWINTYNDHYANVGGKLKSDYDLDVRLTMFWKF